MPNDLVSTDPIVARNFYLEIDSDRLLLIGIAGLEIELDVVNMNTNGKDGRQQHIKTLGGTIKAPDITVTRFAPLSAKDDPIWKWFLQIRDGGMKASNRATSRKNGSIVLYDSAYDEVGRFNWFNGWPSKISTSELTTESQEPMKETIVLSVERIERIK
jgi:phage tail-like protein